MNNETPTVKLFSVTYERRLNFEINEENKDVNLFSHFHPEILLNQTTYKHVHDMYSFGLLLRYLVEGKLFFFPSHDNPEGKVNSLRRFAKYAWRKIESLAQRSNSDYQESYVACLLCGMNASDWLQTFSDCFLNM